MSTGPRYLPHYTIADYELWEGDWELWQGIPVAMTPSPFGRHQELTVKLASALLRAVEDSRCQATVLVGIDWVISDDTVVRPDVLVLCGSAPERHVEAPPAIVAEVLSPSTSSRDRGEKHNLYAEHGVEHYIIIDPIGNTLETFSRNGSQLESNEASDKVSLGICGNCELTLHVKSVLS